MSVISLMKKKNYFSFTILGVNPDRFFFEETAHSDDSELEMGRAQSTAIFQPPSEPLLQMRT